MAPNRPVGRQKHVASGGSGAARRGEGRGSGPVGSSGGLNKKPGSGGGAGRSTMVRGAGVSLPVIIIAALYFLLGGGGGSSSPAEYTAPADTGSSYYSEHTSETSSNSGSGMADFYEYFNQQTGGTSAQDTAQQVQADTSTVDTAVASGARAKRTEILGGGKDTVTLMIYMCGTDLESRSSMATSDLMEMSKANISDNINLLVYTGGCARWQNNVVSSTTNQVYRIRNGQLERLIKDDGAKVMTDPATLSSFIKWSAKNFPANRYELILWDHGGGSVSGYGYDEKNKRAGAMNLAGIKKALNAGGVKFDFIGFDACLMATAETALMLDDYGDYLIASEETEPGIGWYYTDWLSKLSKNTSMPTTEIGKNIVDDFTAACARSCRGQKTTLSLIDLAEFAYTVPSKLSAFSTSIRSMIADKEYKAVSNARYSTREFAQSNRIDQVDLTDLALKMGTPEGQELADTIKDAVKYNKTSSNMTNAYGVSIYFPYQRTSYVDTACSTYSQIGMDEEYAACIREFASLETSGQIAAGGSYTGSPMGSLFGSLLTGQTGGSSYGGSSSGSSYGGSSGGSADVIGQLLGSFLSDPSLIQGLTSGNTSYFSDRALSDADTAEYISENFFNGENLKFEVAGDGTAKLHLPEDQWELVHDLDLNLFYDDGSGYMDLGLDNVFTFDDNGDLIADDGRTWLSINGQVVAYYHESTMGDQDNYTITGYVPALLNGEEVKLMITFDSENPDGYIAGARTVYNEDENLTLAKDLISVGDGDTLDFLCDYYSYDGEYIDNYYIGETLTLEGEPVIRNISVGDGPVKLMYRFTDIYNQSYWTDAVDRAAE
ncbi:MAG: peptidase C11 [Lachnospiraceae bacterium]|nr:peptidase C11 [Lachnospiraceae bacterium]